MEEEKKVNEVPKFETEKKPPMKKWKKVLILAVVTLFVSLMIFGIIFSILFGDNINSGNNSVIYNVSNVYRFSGDILFSQNIGDYTFVVEFLEKNNDVGDIMIDFLYRNVLVSQKVVAESIDISYCNDYGIYFKDYNNDGMLDFSYITSRNGESSYYKIYTLTSKGEIILLNETSYKVDGKKFSVAFENDSGKYVESEIYYDGYKIGTDVGTYELKGEISNEYKKISLDSKLSFSDNRTVETVKTENIAELGTNFFERHSLLEAYSEYEAISVDLDNDENFEKLICFSDDVKGTRIIAFDSEDEVIANLVNVKGKKYSLNSVIELVDLDNDEVIEIITKLPSENEVSISKYNLGYYFPKIVYSL